MLLTCPPHDSRLSGWLADHGFTLDRIKEIDEAFPRTLTIDLYSPAAVHQFRVSLCRGPATAALPTGNTEPAQKPEPPPPFPLSDEEVSKMRWRPSARGMATRRGATSHPGSMMHRQRFPLVNL